MGSRIKANEGSSLEVYDAKVSARSRLYLLKTIGSKLAFKPERYKKFRSTVFGLWLDIRIQEHDNHLINYLLQHQRNVKDPITDIPFIFDIGPNTIEFGRREFCLVTGFLFRDCSLDHLKGVNSCFHERVLLKNSSVKGLDLNKLLNNHIEFNKLLDDEDVHVCLLLVLDFVFMGFELRHVIVNKLLGLVDDLSAWNDFPWEKNVIPRVVAWSDGIPFLKNDYERLFQASTSSDGPSKKKKSHVKHKSVVSHTYVRTEVHRKVDVRTNVHHDVDEGLSVPDVHHDAEEGLSVRELLKKISDMQQDFQSRITAVEQFTFDSHVTNVFSNSMEFDNHDFSSLTENPHNRVALMKKITDMKVEFQRRITSIQDFLKIPRSPNLEKNSNVAAECMFVDKNPSCGSDVKAGNKEYMCVDSSVKTSCATDINANNVDNDSMDFYHDLKVVEQNEFNQNVADKNLIHDFDQTVEWKMNDEVLEEPQLSGPNFIVEDHQQVSSKNCKVSLAGAEKIAVDALMKIINFDIPKEVQREAKASKYRVSPYTIQPKSTQQNHKVRARNKKVKKRGLPLTTHYGKVIPD
ncbi:phospholipase-like protein [Tanacetum coccineum]|uniref:Phospholipase-like protein n=1 Tax=Tanacetum coccineum TaxID=301880 RepID=A0ABQ5IQC7_9ASTR